MWEQNTISVSQVNPVLPLVDVGPLIAPKIMIAPAGICEAQIALPSYAGPVESKKIVPVNPFRADRRNSICSIHASRCGEIRSKSLRLANWARIVSAECARESAIEGLCQARNEETFGRLAFFIKSINRQVYAGRKKMKRENRCSPGSPHE